MYQIDPSFLQQVRTESGRGVSSKKCEEYIIKKIGFDPIEGAAIHDNFIEKAREKLSGHFEVFSSETTVNRPKEVGTTNYESDDESDDESLDTQIVRFMKRYAGSKELVRR